MLELKNIKKDYPAGDGAVHALKGISLQFRNSEFVSVLGPSGCGKTTMLNILGGLDKYTEGDLVINGRSTKDFKDRDWDTYRNHSVGFVFQNYNLIPHQSVLRNVELALTLSGVSKAERRKRAKAALEQVGLGSQLNKRPGEMSGGQMQRVAIARAIVNNPDIVLADEPTGALDTETSIQVMDILKEISKDRLVVMVTHNPDLAQKYSTRIITMLDGEITNDSAPLSEDELSREQLKEKAKAENSKKVKRPSMSFATSFGLSLKNLFTQKGRTALTSFAGSIGIIGIALIVAVSHGMTTYINSVQLDTLSSYPLRLESQHVDIGVLMQTFIGAAQSYREHEKDAVYAKGMVYDLINALSSMDADVNDLASFKKYIEAERAKEGESKLRDAISGVQYSYDLDLLIYTKNVDGNIIHSDINELMREFLLEYMGIGASYGEQSATQLNSPVASSVMMGGMSTHLWQEMLPGDNGKLVSPLLEKQYDLVYGSWPTAYNEVVLVLDKNNELDDMTLYALGLMPKASITKIMNAAINKTDLPIDERKWSYQEICNMEFRTILNSDCYDYDETTGTYIDLRTVANGDGLKSLYANATALKVSGIIRPNEDAASTMLSGSIGYTSKLTEYVIEHSKKSAAVKAQIESPNTDIFTGLPFKENSNVLSDSEKADAFQSYVIHLSDEDEVKLYIKILSTPTDKELNAAVSQVTEYMTHEDIEAALEEALIQQGDLSEEKIKEYIAAMSYNDVTERFKMLVAEQIKADYAAQAQEKLSSQTTAQLVKEFTKARQKYTIYQRAFFYDELIEFSTSTYEDNLIQLGCINLGDPSAISLYSSSFEDKDTIKAAIADYNASVSELKKISYTDYVGVVMASVTTIINAITYVLIAFVSIALVVSSIMIGVITLISVQERTKEIGILRALGASKKNVSRMFNAETVIIGFTSGALGVLITYILCIPINLILHKVTGIGNLSAFLPIPAAVILIVISMALTLISGIIPSRSAAKKDPVVALRTE